MFYFIEEYEGSGRVLDMRSKGYWFDTHLKHCIVFLSMTLNLLLSTVSTQENRKWSQDD